MNIRNRDINLLYLFQILYQEGLASIAAERLAISQPALSHRLNKLRKEFDDPLFVRGIKGLVPTPKAHAIAPQISRLVSELEHFYQSELDVPLDKVKDVIHIYTTDYMESILLPKLLSEIQKIMPFVQIVTHNTQGKLPRKMLENGQCDIAISGFYSDLPSTFYQQKLKEERLNVLARKDHPTIGNKFSLETYLECKHIVTTLTGDLNGVVDKALSLMGKQRNVISGISSFMIPAQIVSQSDFILTCLDSVADQAMDQFANLQRFSSPVQLSTVNVFQIWHERTQHDAIRAQVRKMIHSILDENGIDR
ncbi:MAG: LysR family transcriptional regulator [Shewanella psychromarinicola]|uniref:LysR family transcriptional regulator n=1 Tax=Shewanella psychromarinicola TaxID=2487742 RepID=UPI0030034F43